MGSVRIIAGRLRGRRIEVPDVQGLRPSGSRVREALFNILGQDLTGRRVLDLYSGTGALGFEAVSRGSSRVVLVESSPGLAQGLRKTAESLGVAREARVVVGRVEDVIRTIEGPFDVILADPPYGALDPAVLAESIDAAGLLAKEGVLAVEQGKGNPVGTVSGVLNLVRSARYGGTSLLFFKYRNPSHPTEES